jgi:2C-methyl-D-erythritol 2,4-cyclodiphosphate synthase
MVCVGRRAYAARIRKVGAAAFKSIEIEGTETRQRWAAIEADSSSHLGGVSIDPPEYPHRRERGGVAGHTCSDAALDGVGFKPFSKTHPIQHARRKRAARSELLPSCWRLVVTFDV